MAVELRMRRRGKGTHVTMVEYATGGLASIVPQILMDPPLHLRNVESLRRLRRMAEEGATRR